MRTLIIAALLLIATGASAQTELPINGDEIQNKFRDVRKSIEMKAEQNLERIELHKEDVLERSEERQQNREEIRFRLKEQRQERISGLFVGVADHLNTIVQRFENIVERFESRLSKMEESGVEISDTITALDEVKNGIEDLKNVITEAQSNINTILEGELSRDDIHTEMIMVKEAVENTRESIINALQTFKASIKTDTIEE